MALIPQTRRRTKPDFSLTTVNIVLLLVFFFLLAGTIVETEEMEVNLAVTEDLPLDRLPRPLLLMGLDGQWSLDGQAVTREGLAVVLAQMQEGEERRLYLLSDAALPASELVALVQDPALAGVNLQLVTLHQIAQGSGQ